MAGQKQYGFRDNEKLNLEVIEHYRFEIKPPWTYKKIAEQLNKTCRTKRKNKWSAVMVYYHVKRMRNAAKK
jgi:hypothetical protein